MTVLMAERPATGQWHVLRSTGYDRWRDVGLPYVFEEEARAAYHTLAQSVRKGYGAASLIGPDGCAVASIYVPPRGVRL